MINFGYVPAGTVLRIPFMTFGSSGQSITLTGLAVTDIEIYKDGSVTQRASDAGYTLLDTDGIDFDGITGIHGFSVDTGDNTDSGFYAAGSFYWCVVSAVTVNAQTVNFIAATWWIGPIAANATQFAGQTITAAAGVTLPSTVASPTNITAASGIVLSGVTHTGAVIPTVTTTTTATNVTTVNGLAANVITAASIATDAGAEIADAVWDEAISGHLTAGTTGASLNGAGSAGDPWTTSLPGAYGAGTAGYIVGTNIDALITSRMATYTQPTGFLAATFPTTFPTVAGIADGVWDEVLSGHLTAGTTGAGLNSAGGAGDPWTIAIPGAYSAGTAGYIVGTNLNATVSSRASQTSVDAVDDLLDTEIGALTANLATANSNINTVVTATSAASIRTAVGLASANLDTQFTTVATDISNLSQATVIKNAAYPNFGFPMKLSSDHFSAATGKTVTGQRRLDNGSLTAVSGTITEIAGGLYEFDALAADTNGDSVVWVFSATGCDDTVIAFKTSV